MELTGPDTVSPGVKFNLQNCCERTDVFSGALRTRRKNLLMKFFSERRKRRGPHVQSKDLVQDLILPRSNAVCFGREAVKILQ